MSITVNWPAVANSTGYVLYRNAGSPVNMASPPSDKVDVPAGTTTYTYTSGVNNTLYYILVGAKQADGSITYSDQILVGYYPDTGPGPQSLLRGDWTFGYFGEVSVFELFTVPELYTAFYAQTGANAIVPNSNPVITLYHKCIVNGRIVFMPDNAYSAATTTPTIMQNSKLIVQDADYTNKGLTVAKNGYEFIARCPHASANPVATVLPNLDNVYLSELGMMIALFGTTAPPAIPATPGVVPAAKYRLSDATANSSLNTPWSTALGATGAAYLYANLSTGAVTAGNASNGRPVVVLELLF